MGMQRMVLNERRSVVSQLRGEKLKKGGTE